MKISGIKSFLFHRGDKSWHIPLIASIAQLTEPKVYVEIGIYQAATLNTVAKKCGLAIGVDIDPGARKFIKAKNAEFVSGTITELGALCASRNIEIDLAFIDGDHRSESVMADFAGVDKFASKNALILFHDTWPASAEDTSDGRCSDSYLVPSLIREQTNNEWSTVTIPVFPGLTIASRSTSVPTWLQNI